MKHSLKLMAYVLITIAVGLAGYFGSRSLCARHAAGTDDLAWLRREFRLSQAELASIRALHEAYLPECRKMRARISAKQKEVWEAAAAGIDGPAVEQWLVELGTLWARCQVEMVLHSVAVSRAMPAEPGGRYLSEMARMTLDPHGR